MERKKNKDDKLRAKGEATLSVLTRKTKALQKIESVSRVFGNPLLMDKIVKYSVNKPNGKQIDKPTVISTRLVNKSWLQSTSRILKISGDWTIKLELGCEYGENSLNDKKYDTKQGNILDQIVSVFARPTRSFDSILPIHLIIKSPYFVRENSKYLRNFLEQCGEIISELCVHWPLDGGSMNLSRCHLSFPLLQTLNFKFKTYTSSPNANGLKLLQDILQNSNNLNYFDLEGAPKAAINVSSLNLPETLRTLRIRSQLTSHTWDLLTNNKLPCLEDLELTICDQPEEHLIYRILERFRLQLKVVVLYVTDSYDIEPCTTIKFPVMEKLKSFILSGQKYSLFPQLRHVWPTLLPNLTRVLLDDISESGLLEWVQGSRFENVKKLSITIRRNDKYGYRAVMSPNVQIFREILASFPKLEKLTLDINLNDASDLKYLFKNFTHLKKLRLDFDYDDYDNWELPGYKVVSVFLGISFELATAIVDGVEKNAKISTDNPHSIMNLTELNSLTLWSLETYYPGHEEDPFCSEILLKYGLNKMQNLKKIRLLDGFKPDPLPLVWK